MAIKMKGVLAVPGEFSKDGEVYIKTPEELRDAAERYPILPLTFGHTDSSEPPPRSAQIGTISQKWNEEQQKVLAELWFHEEKIPDKLRSRIDNGEKIPLSAWYLVDSIDEDGTQHGMSYSHVAVLDGEDPVCPITECGAFVRIESKDSRHIFIEHVSDIEPPEKKEEEAPPSDEPVGLESGEEGTTHDDRQPTVSLEEEPKPEEPAEDNLEVSDEPASAPEEVRLEPETVIPTSLPEQRGSKDFEVVDGKYRFVLPIYKKQQEKKE